MTVCFFTNTSYYFRFTTEQLLVIHYKSEEDLYELIKADKSENSDTQVISNRRYKTDKKQRAKLKLKKKHPLLPACKDTCKRRCTQHISEDRRKSIYKEYWSLSWVDQRKFLLKMCTWKPVKRRRTLAEISRRKVTFYYKLTNDRGRRIDVCKVFFLATLGYSKNNDSIVFTLFHNLKSGQTTLEDRRGKHTPANKINRQEILSHAETLYPGISRHDLQVKYLPNDITVAFMYNDFSQKYPGFKCAYETYRKILLEKNIRFTKK